MFIFSEMWTILKSDLKNALYLGKLIFPNIWAKKKPFSKWSLNNIVLLEMLIFFDILTKNCHFKEISKNLKKSIFCLNFDIFRYMGQYRFLKSDLNVIFLEMLIFLEIWGKPFFQIHRKKTLLSSICWYFRIYEQKTIISKWSQNNIVFIEMLIILDILTKNYYVMWIWICTMGTLHHRYQWSRTDLQNFVVAVQARSMSNALDVQ